MSSRRCGRTRGACAWSTSCATCSWRFWGSPMPPSTKCCASFPTRSSEGASGSRLETKPRTFLLHEFDQFSFGYRTDGTAPIQNKVGAFLADPLLNRILTAPEKDLRIRQIMDKGQALLVNLAKGRIGEGSSSLLGALLVTAIGLAAYSRADMPGAKTFSFTSTSSRASRRWQWQACSQLDFGRFRQRGRGHFPCAARYGAEFRYCLGAAVTRKKSDGARFRGARRRWRR